jgi:hypothetical protein
MQDGQIPVVPIVLAIFAIVFMIALIGLAILMAFLISRAAKRRGLDQVRSGHMRDAAAQIGFSFQPQAPLSALPFFGGFELFEGYPVSLENLMAGKIAGRDAFVFDLAYRNVGGAYGGGTTTSRETMFAAVSPDLDLPEFYLRPEGVFEKVLGGISRIDIDFAERPGFSQKFLLYGKDESAIRRLFRSALLDFFEQNANICVFGRGNYLFLYQSRTPVRPEQLGQYVHYFEQVLSRFSAKG